MRTSGEIAGVEATFGIGAGTRSSMEVAVGGSMVRVVSRDDGSAHRRGIPTGEIGDAS